MNEDELVFAVVREWVGKAENDLKVAAHTLRLDEECPTDAVCFHVQQCVEKYLKAFLCLKGVDFPKTHDIESIATLLPRPVHPGLTREEMRRLTGYATVARYPGGGTIPLAEARQAVQLARRVRQLVRKLLPQAARRREE